MRKLLGVSIILGILLGLSVAVNAQTISDVSVKDSSYPAISRAVKEGYLPLYNDDSFLGGQPVSRREMAVIIEKMLSDSDQQTLNFSRGDIQELKTLLKAFKTYMSDYDSAAKVSRLSIAKVENEQKVLNTDLSRMNETLTQKMETMKKEQQEQNFLMWIGIGAAAFLGIAIH